MTMPAHWPDGTPRSTCNAFAAAYLPLAMEAAANPPAPRQRRPANSKPRQIHAGTKYLSANGVLTAGPTLSANISIGQSVPMRVQADI